MVIKKNNFFPIKLSLQVYVRLVLSFLCILVKFKLISDLGNTTTYFVVPSSRIIAPVDSPIASLTIASEL